jgi:hypothetical protein
MAAAIGPGWPEALPLHPACVGNESSMGYETCTVPPVLMNNGIGILEACSAYTEKLRNISYFSVTFGYTSEISLLVYNSFGIK